MCLPKPLRSKFEFGCMRIKCQWRVSIFLALSFCLSAATAAEAQSFFQTLFGNLFKSAPAEKAPRSVPSITFSPRNQGSHFRGPSWGGNYRTVCVRTCDGYYFPISASASRARFSKDSEACEARCGGARLYYLPKHSEDTASMIDLTGRRYDQLDNAFVYRKKLIDGCSCRPMPWSAAERARHNRYAYEREILRQSEERDRKLREQAVALARPPARDDNSPVPAPEPKYIALAGLSERNRLSEVSATNAGAAPAVTGPGRATGAMPLTSPPSKRRSLNPAEQMEVRVSRRLRWSCLRAMKPLRRRGRHRRAAGAVGPGESPRRPSAGLLPAAAAMHGPATAKTDHHRISHRLPRTSPPKTELSIRNFQIAVPLDPCNLAAAGRS